MTPAIRLRVVLLAAVAAAAPGPTAAAQPLAVDLLLTGGTVVTVDPERRLLDPGAVAVRGDRIAAVGPADGAASKSDLDMFEVSHVVYVTRGGDVRDVMVGGCRVVRDRRVLTLDVGSVMAEAERLRGTIARARSTARATD